MEYLNFQQFKPKLDYLETAASLALENGSDAAAVKAVYDALTAALEQSTGDMLAQAQKSLAAAEEALTAVNDAAEKLDVEGLNTAVTELLAVMQPLAEFFARFK